MYIYIYVIYNILYRIENLVYPTTPFNLFKINNVLWLKNTIKTLFIRSWGRPKTTKHLIKDP